MPTLPAATPHALRYLAHRICGARFGDIGDDVMQAGAVALLKAPPHDPAAGNVLAWVITYARFAMLDEAGASQFGSARYLRSLKARGVRIAESRCIDGVTMTREHEGFAEVDRADLLTMGLKCLGQSERAVMEAYYLRGEDAPTIASREGVTKAGVWARLRIGKQRLRRVMR